MKGRSVVLLLALTLTGCGPPEPQIPRPLPPADQVDVRPLPRVEVEQLAGGEGVPFRETVPAEALDALARGERVTLTAVGTDLRSLLAALAEAAGVNLVVGPAVGGRVTVHFENVPAAEALEQVVVESGYMIARPLESPFPATGYYVVPVNVNEADAATIQARFGVSAELAQFLVRARIPRPDRVPPN